MRRRTALSLFSFLSLSSPVATEPLPPGGGFSLPVMCALRRDCWTLNYPDMAEDSRVLDPACGARSYDGHKGTDFAIRDTVAMRRGVNVIASASGTVLRVRDGVADRRLRTANDRSRVAGRECGNGLVIDHGSGWETQYCHLRRRSVVVRPGQTVRRGQQLGKVGLSGRTKFPHVHLSIRHDGRVLDPATGRSVGSGCREKGDRSGRMRARRPMRRSRSMQWGSGALGLRETTSRRMHPARSDYLRTPPHLCYGRRRSGCETATGCPCGLFRPAGLSFSNIPYCWKESGVAHGIQRAQPS